jgi:hypothetical protein
VAKYRRLVIKNILWYGKLLPENNVEISTNSAPHTINGAVPASPAPMRNNATMALEPPGSFAHPDSERTANIPTNMPTYIAQREPWDRQLLLFYQACQPTLALKEYLEDPTGSKLYITHDGPRIFWLVHHH